MTHYHLVAFINISLLLIAFLSGMLRRRFLDIASKIFCTYIGLTLLEECIAYYCAVKFHQNIPVLRVFNLVEIATLSLYFNYCIEFFRKRNIGIHIAIISSLIGLYNMIACGSMYHLSGFFMYYEGIVIIMMALLSLFQLVKSYSYLVITTNPHFWFAFILIIYWCLSIIDWAFYDFFTIAAPAYKYWISYAIGFINYPFYITVIFTFLRYPQKSLNHARPIHH